MATTAKKPRARKINENWAAADSAGLRFRHSWHDAGWLDSGFIRCPCCNYPDHENQSSCIIARHVRRQKSERGRDVVEIWKHARKGSQRDSVMSRMIESCPALQAAIEAAALAAATPAAARPSSGGRL